MGVSRINNSFKLISNLTTHTYTTEKEILEDFIAQGKSLFSLEMGVVFQVEEDCCKVLSLSSPLGRVEEGQSVLLKDTYLCDVLEHKKPIGAPSVQSVAKSQASPFFTNLTIKTHLSAPIFINGDFFGILSFSDRKKRREQLTSEHLDMIELMAKTLGEAIGKKIIQKALEERNLNNMTKLSLLEGIRDNAAHAMITTTLDGIITSFNKAAETMLGYKSEDLVGIESPAKFHSLEEVIHFSKKFSEELNIKVEPGFQTFVCHTDLGLKNQLEWRYIHKDGTSFPVLLSITAIFDAHGNKNGYLGIAQDVSEIRGIEKELRKRNEELAQFAYRTSHDLNSPLISIRGLAEVIKEDLENGDIQEVNTNLKRIIQTASNLEKLVVDILNLTKADLEDSTFEDTDINKVLLDLKNVYDFSLQEKNISFIFKSSGSQLIYTQKARLKQIIENLLVNSIKYCDYKKDKMFVKIDFDVADNVQIKVEDNGIGIPENKQSDLFKMFSRFHPHREQGSGLGMSIVKKNIEHLGGTICFVSNDSGTSFKINLPIKRK